MPPHFLSSAQPGARLTIARTGFPLVQRLEIAGHSRARKKGLIGRDSLAPGHALVIAPSQGVHTFGMRFPIDIVAIDRQGRVIKIRPNVGPNRIVFAWSAFAMLELNAGSVDRSLLLVGDRLLTEIEPI
jgi:uncharacterized protein